jgi:hypothetical protein
VVSNRSRQQQSTNEHHCQICGLTVRGNGRWIVADVSNFVTQNCQHCGGHLEFDADQLAKGESCAVKCPHCGKQTYLSAPAPIPSVPVMEKAKLQKPLSLRLVMKWVVISWSVICLAGLGGCSLLSFESGAQYQQTHPWELDSANTVTVTSIFMSIIGWLVVWAVISAPCVVIWHMSKKENS